MSKLEKFDEFIAMVAGLSLDDESDTEGEAFRMTGEDSRDTLNNLIETARKLKACPDRESYGSEGESRLFQTWNQNERKTPMTDLRIFDPSQVRGLFDEKQAHIEKLQEQLTKEKLAREIAQREGKRAMELLAQTRDPVSKAMSVLHQLNSCSVVSIDQANGAFQQIGSFLEKIPLELWTDEAANELIPAGVERMAVAEPVSLKLELARLLDYLKAFDGGIRRLEAHIKREQAAIQGQTDQED